MHYVLRSKNSFNSVCNKKELPQQWKEFIIVPVYKKGDKLIVVIIQEYHCYQLHNYIGY
jgi:hypothetical protein